jgi:hypothetical protein
MRFVFKGLNVRQMMATDETQRQRMRNCLQNNCKYGDTIGVTWGCKGGMPIQYFFLHKNRFLATELKTVYCQNNYFRGVKTKKEKNENLHFTGRRIEASKSPINKG